MNTKGKLLTLDDLYNFYSTKKKSMNFSADKTGYNLSVQVNGKFEVSKDENSEGLLYAKVRAFHDLGNRNKSYIDTEILEQYLPSMKDRPIMADIIEVEDKDGKMVKDFNGHTMTLSEDGEKIIYIEKPVGHFVNPEDFHLEWSDEYQRHFVCADAVIYEEYTDTCDILRRRETTDCSVELCIRDMAYDCKTKELHINNFYVQGCTLLGSHVQPGMAGSKLSLKDFSEENNSVFSNLSETEEMKEKLIEMQESINTLLSRFNIDGSQESNETYGKEDVIEVGNEEILVNEEVTETVETVVENEETTEVVLNEEATEETVEVTETESTEEVTEVEAEESEDPAEDETPEVVETEFEETENSNEETTEVVETEETAEVNETEEVVEVEETDVKFELIEKSFEVDGRKFSISFELSHSDIAYGLYTLLESYCELDNDWYDIRAVYDDRFVFQGWFTGKIYGQKYTKDGDTVALDGERFELFEELLTATEKAELESMRANYSSIQTELNTYKLAEEKADKMTVFEDENYAQFLETPEFKELIEAVDTYSKEELEDKANIAFSKLVKKNKTFALETPAEEKPKATMFAFGRIETKSSFLDGLLGKDKK